jgi:glycosyltransferase involved in cell wall biosynthesis
MQTTKIDYSIILPIYNNQAFIPLLIKDLNHLQQKLPSTLEAIFVIDGSPDNSLAQIQQHLFKLTLPARIINLSKNFGSFTAIKAGIDQARGKFIAVKAADRQEPNTLITRFFAILLKDDADVVIAARKTRNDPFFDKLTATLFWRWYKRFINPKIPQGGVDIFAFNQSVAKYLKTISEKRSSLIDYLFWLGFRRKTIYYTRLKRQFGKGGWTLSKKLNFAADTIFSFSDLPIKAFFLLGLTSSLLAIILALIVVIAKFIGSITVPGYTAIAVISLFFFGLNSFGLSILGNYIWRIYENTKARPHYIIQEQYDYQPE